MAIVGKFQVGQVYNFTDWFTGGISEKTVENIAGDRIWFGVKRVEQDGTFKDTEDYEIQKDEDGNEYVVIYVYMDHEARICSYKTNIAETSAN